VSISGDYLPLNCAENDKEMSFANKNTTLTGKKFVLVVLNAILPKWFRLLPMAQDLRTGLQPSFFEAYPGSSRSI
jgi:hypothetical protein